MPSMPRTSLLRWLALALVAGLSFVLGGWLLRNFIHIYFLAFVAFIFSGIAQFIFKSSKSSSLRAAILLAVSGFILGGVVALLWEDLFSTIS